MGGKAETFRGPSSVEGPEVVIGGPKSWSGVVSSIASINVAVVASFCSSAKVSWKHFVSDLLVVSLDAVTAHTLCTILIRTIIGTSFLMFSLLFCEKL